KGEDAPGGHMTLTVLPHRDELGLRSGRLFIDGTWREGGAGETWTHVHPATNEEVISFATATAADVADAVGAARRAFDDGDWPTMKARERRLLMQRLSQLISDHGDELDRLQTLDNGMPASFGSIYQVSSAMAADVIDHHA